MDWIDLAQDTDQCQGFENTVWKFWFLQNSTNLLTNRKATNFSRRILLHEVSQLIQQH